ncbi:Rad52-like DNA repair and recombination protein [Tubulinosema ratisbonensis]|uniref:Rad52-like DNA repair and recombination protein n=1 Tax=Tubulinosema ratisbonensis TaxID=291195 RepID=A0A437AI79_9MICR|nr:Rad52-like DNA repair and recombination protein [Tubulinosema ratisbonensis]
MHSIKKKTRKRIQSLLSKKLGPEYISYRQGFNGTKLAYIEGWVAISIANNIFGYDGWSSEIKSVTLDFCDESVGKISLGVSVVVRVSLVDGNFKEDIGFGSSENQRSKVNAFEKAKKEAVTDAIKRALRQFGDALGNCCYDKVYVSVIQKVLKHKNINFYENNLLRKNDELKCEELSDNISTELEKLDLTNE